MQRRHWLVGLGAWLVPLGVTRVSRAATVTVNVAARHRTGRLVGYVLSVLRAHDQACDEGCRYRAPDVARSVILKYRYSPHRYFIWTHVQAFKDARTFQKVTISQQSQRTLFRVTTPRAEEVSELERHTQYRHEPLLDHLDIRITVEAPNAKNGSLTNIYFEAEARASGMVGMFDGVIRRSLEENARALFENIDR